MKNIKISHRYAKALFELAKELNLLDKTKKDMNLVFAACQSNKDFRFLLSNPIIKSDKKIAVINQVFSPYVDKITLGFLNIITKKRRESIVADISEQYLKLCNQYEGIETVNLVTATSASDYTKDSIKSLLKQFLNKQIELKETVDNRLIGGFVINYNDLQYDASISKQIQKLKKDFKVNDYVRKY